MGYPFVRCDWHPGERLGYAACIHVAEGRAVAVSIEAPTFQHLGSALCQSCADQPDEITVDQLRMVCDMCFDLHIAPHM